MLEDLSRAACDACYRWAASFGGFSATISLGGPGWQVEGTMVAEAPGEVVVELAGVDQAAWARRQLSLLVAHRWHRPYESGDGRWPKATRGDERPALLRRGPPASSRAERAVGAPRLHRLNWDTGTGQLLGSDAHEDRYASVDGILLPRRLRVVTAQDGGLVLRELRLRDLTLLPGVAGEEGPGAAAVGS